MQLQVKQIYNPRFIAPNEIRTANISRRQNLTNFYDNGSYEKDLRAKIFRRKFFEKLFYKLSEILKG